MKTFNPEGISDEQLKQLLQEAKTIAIIGVSPDMSSESFQAADYLKKAGYRIIPVTIHAHKLLDEQCHHELNSIQEPVDIVYFFPHPDEFVQKVDEELTRIAEQAELMNIPTLWLHERTRCDSVAEKAANKGMTVIQDSSLPLVHSRLMSSAA